MYFHGNKETPLEQHLYVVSYEDVGADTPPPLTRITAPGYSHSVKMNEVRAKGDREICVHTYIRTYIRTYNVASVIPHLCTYMMYAL